MGSLEGCPFATRCPAKIRPDGWDLPEETWRALDELHIVFRTWARSERSLPELVRRTLGMDVAGDSVSAIVEDLFDNRTYGPDVRAVLDDAVGLAAKSNNARAAERLYEAFGSRCDREQPDPSDHGSGWQSCCLRHDQGYDGVRETTAARERGDRR